MKYAILSDAHGNKPYFDACMQLIDEQRIQHIIYMGDLFGYMADGEYVLDTLRNRNACILKGNHEAMLLGELEIDAAKDKVYRLNESRKCLGDENKTFLRGLTSKWEMDCRGQRLLFVHGAPFDSLNGYLYEDNKDYSWDGQGYHFIFMGHTHRPYIKRSGGTIFVNVGSCGLPRDIGMSPSLSIFDDINMTAEIIRIQMPRGILASDYYCGLDGKVLEVLWRR